MNITDTFNYWDLPRDGHTLFLKDDDWGMSEFVHCADEAAYVLIPACYLELIHKWAKEDGSFQLAPLTEENMRGGFIGTCCSVEMFTDAYASKDKRYPAGAPCSFGQWGGAFTVKLETERCPYYRLRHEPDNGHSCNIETWHIDTFLLAPPHGRSERMVVESILLPHRFLPNFYASAEIMEKFARRATATAATVEESFNGYIGDYCGIPIYTDAHLHRQMVDNSDPITWKVKKR